MNSPTPSTAASTGPEAAAAGAGAGAAVGLGARAATRVEFAIIGLGILALLLIFQPFSLQLFGVGCALVVFAGLVNNLLPLCRPGVTVAALVKGGLIVAGVFVAMLVIALASAFLYARYFVGH
jgi:hypothetical protein